MVPKSPKGRVSGLQKTNHGTWTALARPCRRAVFKKLGISLISLIYQCSMDDKHVEPFFYDKYCDISIFYGISIFYIIDKGLAQKTGAATSQGDVARKILFVLNEKKGLSGKPYL
jgi:hypothetical protein